MAHQHPQPRSAARRLRGFMLLEALVGILLFSLGILGVLMFQAAATKMTADARYRTEAAMYADELIARMRTSNRTSLAANYATGGSAFTAWKTNRLDKAGAGLPGATATSRITADATTGSFEAEITIQWLPPGETSTTPSPYSYSTLAFIDP